MARAVYLYELTDPDFSWLVNSFRDHHPEYIFVEQDSLPVLFISTNENSDLKKDNSNYSGSESSSE
jgi:hypothetical protein